MFLKINLNNSKPFIQDEDHCMVFRKKVGNAWNPISWVSAKCYNDFHKI